MAGTNRVRHGDPGGTRLGHRGRLRSPGLPVIGARGRPDATARTHRWAERSFNAHLRARTGPCSASSRAGSIPTFARVDPVHRELPFDGLNIGGLAGDETPIQRPTALGLVVGSSPATPGPATSWARFAGGPPRARSTRACDLFDSVLPTRVARTGHAWVPGGEAQPQERDVPRRSPGHSIRTVRASPAGRFSRAYLAHLFRAKGAPRIPPGPRSTI